MNATIPPMHAALSVLGTMAGQYIASQGQAPQAKQPVPANGSTQFTGTATLAMCDVCNSNKVFASQKPTPCIDLSSPSQVLRWTEDALVLREDLRDCRTNQACSQEQT